MKIEERGNINKQQELMLVRGNYNQLEILKRRTIALVTSVNI